jgi:tetratricopeptide (TPR) repeat protein
MIIDSVEKYHELTSKYIGVIPNKYFDLLEDFLLGLKNSIEIPNEEIEKWESESKKRAVAEELLSKTAERNNLGIAAEKNGEIEKAIEYYEQNIKDGYPAIHSFSRLMILYHKRKQYQEEIRVIDIAIELFSKDTYKETVSNWTDRKEKVKALLIKAT